MNDKSPGQALDEITGHFAAAERVRMVADQLKLLADRMERSAKGVAVSTYEDDSTADTMLKVAMRGSKAGMVVEMARDLALQAIDQAVEAAFGEVPAPRIAPVVVPAEPAIRENTTYGSVEPKMRDATMHKEASSSDDSFFTEDESRVMNARDGHHYLYGVNIKSEKLPFVARVLRDARDHVLLGDVSKLDAYKRSVGSQTYRRKLFEAAVKEFRYRTGISEPAPISDPPPPEPVVKRREAVSIPFDVAAPVHLESIPAVKTEEISVEEQFVPLPASPVVPKQEEAEQLPLGILPEDLPEFLKHDPVDPEPVPQSWDDPFAGGIPYSESAQRTEATHEVSSRPPVPPSARERSRSGRRPGFGLPNSKYSPDELEAFRRRP